MSFGTGPILPPRLFAKSAKISDLQSKRDEADHAMWSFFKNASLKAGAYMAMTKQLEEQTKRSGATSARDMLELKNRRRNASIWQKTIPMALAAVNNPLHHHSVVEAALDLLNSLIQPKCSSALSACATAVKFGIIPSLTKLLLQHQTLSSSNTLLQACAVIKCIASTPRHRIYLGETSLKLEQLLVEILLNRPTPDIVNAALHCLQNISIDFNGANRILDTKPTGGLQALTMLLNDGECVKASAGVLANLASHGTEFRKRVGRETTIKALLNSISAEEHVSAAVESARAIKSLVLQEADIARSCGMLSGVAILESLRLRLGPLSQSSMTQIGKLMEDSTPSAFYDPGRRKPPRPPWFDPLIVCIRQSNRAARRALIIVNDFTQFSAVCGQDRHKWRNGFLPSNYATLQVLQGSVEQAGFEVSAYIDSSRRVLCEAINQFIDSLRENDVAMLCFVGHGTAVDGDSYLLPFDFPALGRLREATNLGISIRRLASRASNKVGPGGIFIGTFEVPVIHSGDGQRFPSVSPVDCSQISKHNNVCLTFCSTRAVSALDGSSFQPNRPRNECSPPERQFFETTAFTFELCSSLTDKHDPVEVTMLAKRLRQRLMQYATDDFSASDGRLPWCNSNTLKDFFFTEKPGAEDVNAEKRRQGGQSCNNLSKKRGNSNRLSSSLKSGPKIGATPSPPSLKLRINSKRSPRPPKTKKTTEANRQSSPRHGISSVHGSYEVTRNSKYEGMNGTSKQVNLTKFVKDSMFLKSSGTDVASSARWTSSLRSSTSKTSSSNLSKKLPYKSLDTKRLKGQLSPRAIQASTDVGSHASGHYFYQFLTTDDIDDNPIDDELTRQHEPSTFSNNKEPESEQAFVATHTDRNCDEFGHDWITTLDNLECIRCGTVKELDLSQDVYAKNRGFVAEFNNRL